MSKRMTKSKSLPWFRIFSKAFITETLGLNATETGIYIRLLAAMNEADEPITGSALNILPRLIGVRQKTFGEAVEKLIERNLIDRLPEGLWAPLMDEERAFRDRNSDKARSNSVKRWRKTQQNQSGSDATHNHTHREPPQGGSRYEDNSKIEDLDIDGPASANAGRPDIGDGDNPPTADEAHRVYAEAFEAIFQSGDDPSLAGHDRHRGNADDKSSAGGNQNADADRSDDDADQGDTHFVSKDDQRLKALLVDCRVHRGLFDQAEYSSLLAIENAILAEGGLDADQMVDLQELAGLVAKRTDKLANAGAEDAGWPRQNTNSSQKEAVQ